MVNEGVNIEYMDPLGKEHQCSHNVVFQFIHCW